MKAKPGRQKKEVVKNVKEKEEAPIAVLKEAPEEVVKEVVEKSVVKYEPKIAESRKVLETPLQPGQAFFESPEGEILIGEAGKDRMWSRTMNHGKGGWANPRR